MSYQSQNPFVSVAESAPETRAAFIRKTYTHLAGAVLAFIGVEYLMLEAGCGLRDPQLYAELWKYGLAGNIGSIYARKLVGSFDGCGFEIEECSVLWPGNLRVRPGFDFRSDVGAGAGNGRGRD